MIRKGQFAMKKFHVLCAMRDARAANSLRREMNDGERCEINIVHDGALALRYAQRIAPDILVVDAVLPDVDGFGVVDCMRGLLGSRMPRVIGGSTMGFADAGFLRRGADRVLSVPWEREALRGAILELSERIDRQVDWTRTQRDYERAGAILSGLGMRRGLRGFHYLAWAGALAFEREDRLCAIGERLYRPIAGRFGTSTQSIERLIRHAVESTMDAVGARGMYGFFGNTIDPTRGKPTNAQMIGMLAQRLKVS